MAKLFKLSEENQKMVDQVIGEFGLDNYMNVQSLGISKQKQIIKVSRANATTEYVGKISDAVFLYIREDVFDMLKPEQKMMIIKDAIAQIYYDPEKDRINILKPEITLTVGSYEQYGKDIVDAIVAGVYAQQQIAEQEKERKAAEKAAKKTK